MIGKLYGVLDEKGTNSLCVNVNGVCYEVETPLSTLFALPDVGEKVQLFTHFVVREDAQLLYGFGNRTDRDMFRVLIRVNGVGPKLGIAILSGLDSQMLVKCVLDDDVSTLVKVPGIGKKTAERLLIELRDKVKDFGVTDSSDPKAASDLDLESKPVDLESEAESALVALGYKPQEAAKAIKRVASSEASLEDLIKGALKSMM